MGRAVVASGNNRSDSPFAPLEVHPSFVLVLLRFQASCVGRLAGRPCFPPLRCAATVHRAPRQGQRCRSQGVAKARPPGTAAPTLTLTLPYP